MGRDCKSSLVTQLWISPTQGISGRHKDGMVISIEPLTTCPCVLGAVGDVNSPSKAIRVSELLQLV